MGGDFNPAIVYQPGRSGIDISCCEECRSREAMTSRRAVFQQQDGGRLSLKLDLGRRKLEVAKFHCRRVWVAHRWRRRCENRSEQEFPKHRKFSEFIRHRRILGMKLHTYRAISRAARGCAWRMEATLPALAGRANAGRAVGTGRRPGAGERRPSSPELDFRFNLVVIDPAHGLTLSQMLALQQ